MPPTRIWIVGVLLCSSAWAQTAVEPAVAAVERVGPTVVNLSTERLVERKLPPQARRPHPSAPKGSRVVNLGSGVIVDPAGFVLTNAHVVARASRILVGVPGLKGQLEGELVAVRYADDLALLKINANRPLPAIELAELGSIKVGQTCLAFGNPYGLESSVSKGVVSARGRRLRHQGHEFPQRFLQTDAAINPGNSGGPLVDLSGRLIGINTAVHDQAQGIGFAIPVGHLRDALSALSSPEVLAAAYTGLTLSDDDVGTQVTQVAPKSPAAAAGIQVGDRVVAAGARPVRAAYQVHLALAEVAPRQPLRLALVNEQGARRGATLTPEASPARLHVRTRTGLVTQLLTPGRAWKLGLDEPRGVHVIGVLARGPGAEVGVQSGDVLTQVGRKGGRSQTVSSPLELARYLQPLPAGAEVTITVSRNGRAFRGSLKLQ